MSTRPRPANRDAFPLFRSLQTRWMDNDIYGHLNNVVHYSLFDTAINGWLIEQGVLDTCQSEGICLVVETGCNYFAELRFPDVIDAGIRVKAIGRSSIRYEVALFRNSEFTASAQGKFVHVHVDPVTHRPTEIPQKMRAALSQLHARSEG